MDTLCPARGASHPAPQPALPGLCKATAPGQPREQPQPQIPTSPSLASLIIRKVTSLGGIKSQRQLPDGRRVPVPLPAHALLGAAQGITACIPVFFLLL